MKGYYNAYGHNLIHIIDQDDAARPALCGRVGFAGKWASWEQTGLLRSPGGNNYGYCKTCVRKYRRLTNEVAK